MNKLSKPFTGNYALTQKFGENLNDYYVKEGLLGHGGLDFACPLGTPILSCNDGTVIFVSSDIRRGEGVSIRSDETFQYNGQDCKFSVIYWHLKDKSIVVKVGDKVTKGQLLGLSNNTGQSTGNHLHLGVFPLSLDGSREVFLHNGYKGAIDPLPFLDLPDPLQKFKDLQTFLNLHGAKLEVDGRFGALSNKALNDFLRS